MKEVFRRFRSQPIVSLIGRINPILRGWVNYFAIGYSSRCFNYIRDWVERKVRRNMARAQKRSGLGWKRWSKHYLYGELGLFGDYRIRRAGLAPKALPA